MCSLTGSSSAKRAAEAQARALEEQTRQAQNAAQESARQAAIQTQQAQEREAATRDVEALQAADAAEVGSAEVSTGSGTGESTTRKRAKFTGGGQSMTSLSI